MGLDCNLFALYAAILCTRMWCYRKTKLDDHTTPVSPKAIQMVIQDFLEYSNMFKRENKVKLSEELDSFGVRTNSWIPPSNEELKLM